MPIETNWTGYTFTVDTTTGATIGQALSLLVKLDVWRSPELSEATVLWDDVSLVQDETEACSPPVDAGR
jgi:hypothetical protein